MSNKKRITSFNFKENLLSGQGAHVALVEEGANEQECLIMKAAKQVTVQLSMVEFLGKFFGMWSDDAELLAKSLGFDIDTYSDSHEEYITEKAASIQFLKGKDIPKELPQSLINIIKSLQDSFEVPTNTSDEETGVTNMPQSQELKDLLKAKEDLLKAKEDQDKQITELLKAAKIQEEANQVTATELADLKKAKLDAIKEETLELVKGFNFVEEDQKEALVQVLMSKEGAVVANVLEAARDLIKTAIEAEVGEDVDVEDEVEDLNKSAVIVNNVKEILKKRKA
jgi:hypothetical protein